MVIAIVSCEEIPGRLCVRVIIEIVIYIDLKEVPYTVVVVINIPVVVNTIEVII